MKFFSLLMLKIFSSHLSWKLSWTSSHKWSPLFRWTWTRLNFPLQKGLPWCTSSYETWLTGATLIEIGVYTDNIRVALNKKSNIKKKLHKINKIKLNNKIQESPTYKQYLQRLCSRNFSENVLIDWASLGTGSWNSGVL